MKKAIGILLAFVMLFCSMIVVAADTCNHEYIWITVSSPDCGNAGEKYQECRICGDLGETVYPEATGEHVYDRECDGDCNVCGEERTPPHAFVWIVVMTATCGRDGYEYEECSLCYETRDEKHIESSGEHTFVACRETCLYCFTPNPNPHAFVWCLRRDATCRVPGVETQICKNCGMWGAENEIPQLPHTYDDDNDLECNFCYAHRAEPGHTYDNACDADCNNCGEVREISGHVYDNPCDKSCNLCKLFRETTHAYDNDCDSKCNYCGYNRVVPGHVYDNSCDSTCNVCSAERTVSHDMKWLVDKPATCGMNGYKHEECEICGFALEDYFSIPATGEHGYTDDNDIDCNVCGEIRTIRFSGWILLGNEWYFYDNGVFVINSWKRDSVGWVYLGSDGAMLTNSWAMDSVDWCYVGANGYLLTDCWMRDSVGWCYLGSDGRIVRNLWVRDSMGWCYVGSDGYTMTSCWMQDSVGWCYLDENGYWDGIYL